MMSRWSFGTAMVIATCASALVAAPASAQGTCTASTPQYCPAPAATTGQASNVTASSATLNGTVNPNGAPTVCAFAYGTSSSYTSTTPPQTIPAGSSPVTVSAPIDGLESSTTFHFAIACQSAGGTSTGADATFTTLDHGPSRLVLVQHAGFVSHHRVVGFVISCFGDRDCNGALALTRHGSSLAPAVAFHIRSQSAAVVYLKLTKRAYKKLKHKRHGLKATLTAADSDHATATQNITLRRWI